MKITTKRAQAIIGRYFDLRSIAEQFMWEVKKNRADIRFTQTGNIEAYENHSCHCHPEYWWEEAATWDEFSEWLDKQ